MDNQYNNIEYPNSEETELIIGSCFEVYNSLGYGLKEKYYHNALKKCFEDKKIKYKSEKYGKIKYKNTVIGKYYLDFLVNNKIAVELKVRNEIYQKDINQLLNYIKSEKLPVGLLVVFSKEGVLIKRLANTKSAKNQRERISA